jgi:hypothetical protein
MPIPRISVPVKGTVIAPKHGKTKEHFAMCMNCGCGQYSTKHKPTDITLEDLTAAAKGHDIAIEEAADNIHNGARELKTAGKIS